jgi:hypothetical protein
MTRKCDNEGLLLRFRSPASNHSVVFEDNGRVAYAYLLLGIEIIADVWLYNHGLPPQKADWSDPSKMPFQNPKGFACEACFTPIVSPTEIAMRWRESGSDFAADILLRDHLHAQLSSGSKPGRCVLAAKDGPLAKVLTVVAEANETSP